MINLIDYRSLITHVLQEMGASYSNPDAVSLVLRTCLHESGLHYLRQIGGGPARGFAQIELSTARDILGRYLLRADKADLRARVHSIVGFDPCNLAEDNYQLDLQLQGSMILGIVCCRLKYWMAPKPLPSKDDVVAQGRYWKHWYNTPAGKGTVEDFVDSAALDV